MPESAPSSPCINVCKLDERDWCIGCFRSRDEIARWSQMSAAEQWRTVEAAAARRADDSK